MAIMLASCGIWGKYDSQTEVPDNAFGNEAAQYMADSTDVSLGAISWRYVFTDPKLQKLIETALTNNKDLLEAHENVVQAEAALKSARMAYLPSLVLGSGSTPSVTWTSGGKWDYNTNLYAAWQLDFFPFNLFSILFSSSSCPISIQEFSFIGYTPTFLPASFNLFMISGKPIFSFSLM